MTIDRDNHDAEVLDGCQNEAFTSLAVGSVVPHPH